MSSPTCNFPGCDSKLRSDNTTGLCKPHVHAPEICLCQQCKANNLSAELAEQHAIGMTAVEASKVVGCTADTARKWARRHGEKWDAPKPCRDTASKHRTTRAAPFPRPSFDGSPPPWMTEAAWNELLIDAREANARMLARGLR